MYSYNLRLIFRKVLELELRVRSLVLLLLLASCFAGAQSKLSPDELIAKHLGSIGTAETRAKEKAIAVFGVSMFDGLTTADDHFGHFEGSAKLVSQGELFQYLSDFNSPLYDGELIAWNGKESKIATRGQNRVSYLATFFNRHPYFIRDGLFGGTLNKGWALENTSSHNPKIRFDGLKKYNGRQLLQLTYDPFKSEGALYAKIYFEPDTFRHVATVYLMDEIPRVEERFSEFKTVNGLTIPQKWDIYLTDVDSAAILRWKIQLSEIRVLDSLPTN
jgi:hypothetical protein